jgi:hypothetical protein
MISAMFWDLLQNHWIRLAEGRVGRAERRADRMESSTARLNPRIAELESTFDRMLLANRALWELVRDRLGVDDATLEQKIEEIDLRDGVRDGRATTSPRQCTGCGRTLHPRHVRCLYCGAEGV